MTVINERMLALAFALMMTGCAARGPHLAAGDVVTGGPPLVPEHTLTAGDEFEIRFPFSPEFNDRVSVGGDGTVSPKTIGNVVVGGLTVPEATARLTALYAKQLRYPDLSLTVRAYAPEVFWVEGEVVHPGLVHSALPLTLERAIAEAGGATIGAKTGDILVIRRDAAGGLHAYQTALAPLPGATDPILKSFDIVYVPQTVIGSVGEFLNLYAKNLPFSANYQITPTPPAARTVVPPTRAAPP